MITQQRLDRLRHSFDMLARLLRAAVDLTQLMNETTADKSRDEATAAADCAVVTASAAKLAEMVGPILRLTSEVVGAAIVMRLATDIQPLASIAHAFTPGGVHASKIKAAEATLFCLNAELAERCREGSSNAEQASDHA